MTLSIGHKDSGQGEEISLFESIALNISTKGYSIHLNALTAPFLIEICDSLHAMPSSDFKRAGVGRDQDHTVTDYIRTDEVCWIQGESRAEKAWLSWAESLKSYLNRRLFLGLLSFESHFARYARGAFYKKHKDSFNGEANRVLSIVVYLNNEWLVEDGGELVIYAGGSDGTIKVTPEFGTIVVFLSEEISHEVFPAKRDRYSIAGWFRVNNPALH